MIDPLSSSQGIRRSRRAETERSGWTEETTAAGLPVPVGPPRTIPTGSVRFAGSAAIDAQVIGERRGLRAGPTIHDQAKTSYNQTEWSGLRDRRAPKGRSAATSV